LLAALEAGHAVVAPNAELAQALLAAVEQHHLDAGHDVWPTPAIHDFGSWLRQCHERRLLTDASAPRCLGDFEERELWRQAILAGGGAEVLDPSGVARAARRVRRALYDHGIAFAALEAHDSDEVQALVRWIRIFDARCRELGCLSADELAATVGAAAAPVATSVDWIESSSWRPAARQWLSRHAGRMLEPAAAAPAETRRLQALSPAAELAEVAGWAQSGLEADPDFRAWICVPGLGARRSEVIDAFDAALAPRRFWLGGAEVGAIYAVAGGISLADYAPVRAALDLLSGVHSLLPFEGFSALLRSPEWHASSREAVAAAMLDVALRRRAPSEAPWTAWVSLCERLASEPDIGPVAAVARLRQAGQLLDRTGGRPMSSWAAIWIAAFEAGPWSQRHRWSSSDYQAAERLRQLMAELASADVLFGSQTRGAAQRILATAAREALFQPRTGMTPIRISGQCMDPWLRYDGIWVAGLDEQNWPPATDPLPLLPVRLQREHGVLAAASQLQLDFARDLQKRWRLRAGQLTYSCADSGDSRPFSPSPLLPEVPLLSSRTEPQPHWRASIDAAPELERLMDEDAPPFDAGERTRGVATLRAQSRCGFRGFAETRLAADGLDLPTPGFNDRERGHLVHRALQEIWSTLGDSAALAARHPPALQALVDAGVVRALAAVCAHRDPGARWRARERRRLNALLANWLELERQRPPFRIEHLEEGAMTARHAGVDFTVRIDRVDRLADGGRVVIDYKTGMAAPDWRGERPDNPQLPLYGLLFREDLVAVAYGQVNAAQCRFVAEAERPVFKTGARRTSLEGQGSLSELLKVWSRRIDALAADFAAGRSAVAPTPRACESCHLQGLCRVPAALADGAA
jgi:probable DNA repair protein